MTFNPETEDWSKWSFETSRARSGGYVWQIKNGAGQALAQSIPFATIPALNDFIHAVQNYSEVFAVVTVPGDVGH